MKRKSSKRSTLSKVEDEENGVQETEENDDTEEPKVKKSKKSKGRKSKSKHESDESEEETEKEQENGDTEEPEVKKSKKSKGRKSKSKHESEESTEETEKDQSADDDLDPLAQDGSEDEAQYEVEAILDHKGVKGSRHFLIRWKGYTEESDTWEPEHTLDCADLIKEYKNSLKGDSKADIKTDDKAETKRDKKDKKGRPKKGSKDKKEEEEEEWDENEDFEVNRILDVYFHKNGKRDFLVSWKGYPSSQNSWEPEDNMDCKDLIKKYMEKVDAAKKIDSVDTKLRVIRKTVNRLEFSMHANDRRLSRRHRGKDRVHYFDAE